MSPPAMRNLEVLLLDPLKAVLDRPLHLAMITDSLVACHPPLSLEIGVGKHLQRIPPLQLRLLPFCDGRFVLVWLPCTRERRAAVVRLRLCLVASVRHGPALHRGVQLWLRRGGEDDGGSFFVNIFYFSPMWSSLL